MYIAEAIRSACMRSLRGPLGRSHAADAELRSLSHEHMYVVRASDVET